MKLCVDKEFTMGCIIFEQGYDLKEEDFRCPKCCKAKNVIVQVSYFIVYKG